MQQQLGGHKILVGQATSATVQLRETMLTFQTRVLRAFLASWPNWRPDLTGRSWALWLVVVSAFLGVIDAGLVLSAEGAGSSQGDQIEQTDSRIWDATTGQNVALEAMVADLAKRDVVFLGEDHDSGTGHQLQLEVIRQLHKLRPDVVISMEMFEQDTQGVLDDYLRGRASEEAFLQYARPWDRYRQHYRPIVEYARQNDLDVVAANVPQQAARNLSQDEPIPATLQGFIPRKTTAPEDDYWDRFCEAMKDHMGTENQEGLRHFYQAQCLKDDGMAEAVVAYRLARPHRRPLMIHLCGKFHSDYGHGTVARVQSRRPLWQLGVVSMEAVQDVAGFEPLPKEQTELANRCHYLLVLKAPEKDSPGETAPEKESAAENVTPDRGDSKPLPG